MLATGAANRRVGNKEARLDQHRIAEETCSEISIGVTLTAKLTADDVYMYSRVTFNPTDSTVFVDIEKS